MTLMTETDLAARIVEWLKAQHWEVYQEVAYCGKVADIVAVNGYLTWIIECKRSMSLALIDQAFEWSYLMASHYLSVAVPYKARWERSAQYFLRREGIGLLTLRAYDVYEQLPPKLNRKANKSFRESLNDRQKTYAMAGNAERRYWTPFKETCMELKRFVAEHPGVCLKDAIDGIQHHYQSASTARACISQYLRNGKTIVRGVEARSEGKYLRLYPVEDNR